MSMTLGELIEELKDLDPEAWVYIKPYDLVPTGFDSYRGYYEDLALNFDTKGICEVKTLLKWAENTVGKTLLGYKGGEFYMGWKTPVWLSNYGKVSSMMLSKIEAFDGYVYLYGEKEE